MKLSKIFEENLPLQDRIMSFLQWSGIQLRPTKDNKSMEWPFFTFSMKKDILLPDGYRDKLSELGIDMSIKYVKQFVYLYFKGVE